MQALSAVRGGGGSEPCPDQACRPTFCLGSSCGTVASGSYRFAFLSQGGAAAASGLGSAARSWRRPSTRAGICLLASSNSEDSPWIPVVRAVLV
ncbi:hypothetical protein CHLRE_02g143052v5 [Chlamydomonas reinhardtii]|uniref:Uncharacterized protein n=1 Tax=Chlamydomonas reinhardtii TaxID=3055 RepID=A0A2K3E412_CHLRE|nr:uncharacterized protein CHLRE_02g143052v5 [Chlamydomonas reinhardtii]PNW87519.1 hypothetical protein CHLRE_02g143052v5 [Chlamydomonas reinhardtii]